jgi:hypothetical protein
MTYVWIGLGIAAVLLLLIVASWRWFHRTGQEILVSRARESFKLQSERLHELFFNAASASGKPRGLRWKNCEFGNDLKVARDRHTGELLGLVPVTIQFEAIPGSDMEGLPAVGNLRSATAVFVFQRGEWTTNGRAVMNLDPAEALRHFQKSHEAVAIEGTGPS